MNSQCHSLSLVNLCLSLHRRPWCSEELCVLQRKGASYTEIRYKPECNSQQCPLPNRYEIRTKDIQLMAKCGFEELHASSAGIELTQLVMLIYRRTNDHVSTNFRYISELVSALNEM